MSLIKTIRQQLGLSVTPANNFTLDASADNGTMKLSRGNAGSPTQDIMTVDADGFVYTPSSSVYTDSNTVTSIALSTAVMTAIPMTTLVNTVGNVTLSAGGLKVPKAGIYIVEGVGYAGGAPATASGCISAGLSVNGTQISNGIWVPLDVTVVPNAVASNILKLNANDVVGFMVISYQALTITSANMRLVRVSGV